MSLAFNSEQTMFMAFDWSKAPILLGLNFPSIPMSTDVFMWYSKVA